MSFAVAPQLCGCHLWEAAVPTFVYLRQAQGSVYCCVNECDLQHLTEVLPVVICSKTVSIDGFEDVPKSDEHALRQAVSQQPISVAICASELQFYGSGEPPHHFQ